MKRAALSVQWRGSKLPAMAHGLLAPIDSFDDLAHEDNRAPRHEYVAGRIHAMTGGSMRHNRIALNIAAQLMTRLAGSPGQVFINDMQLHVQAANSVYYPDVFVYCGTAVAGAPKVVTDASLIVEVLSESTEDTDRREKRLAYQMLPGLRGYWGVSQDEMRVDQHLRGADGRWVMAIHSAATDALQAQGVPGAPMALADCYIGTDIG